MVWHQHRSGLSNRQPYAVPLKLRLPNVYTILPGVPFARALAVQLWEEYKHDLPALSDIQIYLPNRRSVRALADMFLEVSDGQATLLPRLTPLGDIDEEDLLENDPFILEEDPFLTPAIPAMERQVLLAKLIMAWPAVHFSAPQAFSLAGDLASLLDRAHTEQVDLTQIDTLVTGELASHWQVTREFLSIIIHQWPKHLAENNLMDPAQRRNLIFEKKIASLRKDPPTHRIIAAGSTGSIPVTRKLLDVISRLPNGSVILPGFDPAVDEKIWNTIDEMHPYYYQKQLIQLMEIDPHSVQLWPGSEQRHEKLRLAHYAMQSQDSFDLSDAMIDPDHLGDIDFIAAENPLHEAKIIALSLREVLNNPEQTAMVVTPDRVLAQHIMQEMQRWDVTVNDSGGQPLSHTSVGLYLKLITVLAANISNATDLLSLMRHPLFRLHGPAENRIAEISALELALRRNFMPQNSIVEFSRQQTHPILTSTLSVLEPILNNNVLPLHEWIELHIHVAEALSVTGTIPGAEILWCNEDGETASQALAKLHEAAAPHQMLLSAGDYSQLIETIFSQLVVRPSYGAHPRLRILSNIEARLQDADLVILAGLNETVWPAPVKADAWLSRPMLQEMQFGSPDRRIGQSALDFMTQFCMPKIRITWSKKREGVAVHPSRWLQQVFAVLQKNNALPDITASPYYHWAKKWDKPETIKPQAAPSYSPPLNSRPRSISVTQIGTWQKDPYSLYARHILRLFPHEALDRQPDARDWGNAAHDILEHFFSEKGFEQPDPAGYFDIVSERTLRNYPLNKAQEKSWVGRLAVIRDWLLDNEQANMAQVKTEVTMAMEFPLADGTRFKLHGRADRIDNDGGLLITDYKTGSIPTDTSIKNGLSPQMPLLGLLAQQQSKQEIALRYIKLSGKTAKPAETKVLKNPAELIALNQGYLQKLLEDYYTQGIAYIAQPSGKNDYDDYHHLKRVAEWAALDEEENDVTGEEYS